MSSMMHNGGVSRLEELTGELQRKQQQLMDLQRQQELIEAQKKELEELSQRQREVEAGKKEMTEKLRRAQGVLERELDTAQREVEQINQSLSAFSSTLRSLDEIVPSEWNTDNISDDLAQALSRIDHARAIYNQNQVKIKILRESESEDNNLVLDSEEGTVEKWVDGTEGNFASWLKRGFALNLPLLLLGTIWLVVYLFKH